MHKSVAALFALFAYFQYNDPDWYIWIPVYLVVSVVAIAYDYRWQIRSYVLVLCFLYIVGLLSYLPEVISWIDSGAPTIAGSMKAESPFIEFIREFFGLFIALAVLLLYARKMN